MTHLLQLQSQHSLSNAGLLAMWKSFYSLLMKVLSAVGVENLQDIEKALPKSMYSIWKLVTVNRDNFTKYVLCRKCHTRYTIEQSKRKLPNGNFVSATCTYVKYAEHRLQRMRRPCGELLMRNVVSKSGKTFLYPRKTFCHQPLTTGIQRLFDIHENFIELTEHWRKDFIPSTDFQNRDKILCDVYDGKIWSEFQTFQGMPFLSEQGNLALMFNIDWFQPFKHSKYSVGALYFAVMNLPRHMRFKPENIILCGIIDGPKEPKLNVNSCLVPVVNELLHELWTGIFFNDHTSLTGKSLVRAAVLCVASDIPACRKSCGFVGHSATQGCSKCTTQFPRLPNELRADYSDFESERQPRVGAVHIEQARRTLNCATETDRNALEMRYGARWSAFFDLPYFNPIRMHVVDPMHNLYSGSVSHTIEVWKDRKVLTKTNMDEIQEKVDSLKVPSSVGRIPNKVESNFSSLTADQLRTWLHVYSIYATYGLVENVDLNIWRIFEKACRLISGKSVKIGEAMQAHDLFRMYCVAFRNRYGRECCTMNHHLHGHQLECILDFGPIYAFWLFSFERYNGIFEHFHTNNRDVAAQLFRKFLTSQMVAERMGSYSHGHDLFWQGLAPNEIVRVMRGSLGQIYSSERIRFEQLVNSDDTFDLRLETDLNSLKDITGIEGNMFEPEERMLITEMLSSISPSVTRISHTYSKYSKCFISGQLVNIRRHASDRSCCIAAKWITTVNGVNTISLKSDLRPGFLTELKRLFVFVDSEKIPVNVAKVEWMDDSDMKDLYGVSSPVSVWSRNNVPENHTSYIPLGRIRMRCAFVETELPHRSRRQSRVVIDLP